MGGELRWFREVLANDDLDLLVSSRMLEEVEGVVSRPYFRKYFPVEEAVEILAIVKRNGTLVKVKPPYDRICRDPKDDYLLALAKKGKADFLITGDEDLLVLKKHGKTRILKPAAFRKEFL
ncbi:MAG: putative toxin-antitoxin system toxin component, PIN family [Flavobacteriales bacterium]|nr:putative toxin-antitoxin system toxin component, PIN family [Flavobacteriales bacterium]